MICDFDIQSISEDVIKLLIEKSKVRVFMFWCIPTVVPVIGERTWEEIPIRTNCQIPSEIRVKPLEKVFEAVKGSGIISVPSVVMWPQRIEENTRQDQEVKSSVLFKPKHAPRVATIDLTAYVHQRVGYVTVLSKSKNSAITVR
jgi:hypothetical protein